jgi:hypothetical protein
MSDEADYGSEREQEDTARAVAAARATAAAIPKGIPGECIDCGEYSERLVVGSCARCRDKYRHAGGYIYET